MNIDDKSVCLENIYNLLNEDSEYWGDEIEFIEDLIKSDEEKVNILLENFAGYTLLKENLDMKEIPKDRDCIILKEITYKVRRRHFDLDKNITNLIVYKESKNL
jgi:hypothetical protein